MTLRQKTLWVIGSALIALLLLLLSISSTILLKGFQNLENQAIAKNVARLANVLAEEFNNLFVEAGDYAAWDDTYAYVKTRDEEYVISNLGETTFDSLNLSFLILLDINGEIVFARSHDATSHQVKPLEPSLFEHFTVHSLFKYHPGTEGKITGLLLLPEQVMLVASYPILTSKDEGISRGTLIMGRLLDEKAIQRISQLTYQTVSMQRLDNQNLPDDFAQAHLHLLNQLNVVQIIETNHIAGYILMKDIYQQPAILLRVEMARDIYQQGLTSLRSLSQFVLVFVLILAGVILWLFERLVLVRLATLNREVTYINAIEDLPLVTVDGNDELASLAIAINNMLKALHAYHAQIKHSKTTLFESQRIAHLGNWDWDIINNRLNCSDEIYRIFGLSPQSVKPSYKRFLTYVFLEDRSKVINRIKKAIHEEEPYEIEHRILLPNSTIRFIHIQGEIIRDNRAQIIYIIGTLQDVTEHKLAQERTLRMLEENQRTLADTLRMLEENQRTQAKTLQLLEDNRFWIARSMAIQEEENKKLARELHDEFGQCITAIQADAATIVELTTQNHYSTTCALEKMTPSAHAIVEVSTHAYEIVHSLMRQLRPSGLEELGLVETLRDLVTTWQNRHQTRCTFITTGNLHHLGETLNIHIYRIVQECLTNIAKYAHASHVSITLNTDSITKTLTVCVQDNGCGMNPAQHKRGLGLIGMRERAQALDGELQLESAPSKGVKIIVTIPITEESIQKYHKWT